MNNNSRDFILNRIRRGLKSSSHIRDENLFPVDKTRDFRREAGDIINKSQEVRSSLLTRFMSEAGNINATVENVKTEDGIKGYLDTFAENRGINSFSIWESTYLKKIGLKKHLKSKGLKVITAKNKDRLAQSDLGITEVDYAIADMGTLVVLADKNKPRSVSLLPPVHIAIVKPENIVSDINELFAILKSNYNAGDLTNCMNFITGPSRTADIELSLTLGVHGPKELIVLVHSN